MKVKLTFLWLTYFRISSIFKHLSRLTQVIGEVGKFLSSEIKNLLTVKMIKIIKTYGEKPLSFSFEENGEMYMIGSEVSPEKKKKNIISYFKYISHSGR